MDSYDWERDKRWFDGLQVILRKVFIAVSPRRRLLRSVLSNGAVVLGENRAGYGGRGVFIYRDAIEPELFCLESFLDSGNVFIDVGANTGIYSLKAAKSVGPSGVVLAIEPFLDVMSSLKASVQANGFSNVRLRNFCAGERTEVATLWLNNAVPNTFSLVNRRNEADGLSVLAIAIDDLVRWECLSRVDYIKIDVEGAERQVLLGAIGTISRFRPIIQAEVLVDHFEADLPDYSCYQAPGSVNVVYIPNESAKASLPFELGWKRLGNVPMEKLSANADKAAAH